MIVDLSKDEIELIGYSLSSDYAENSNKLIGNNLGDLERKFIELSNIKIKALILKLDEEN